MASGALTSLRRVNVGAWVMYTRTRLLSRLSALTRHTPLRRTSSSSAGPSSSRRAALAVGFGAGAMGSCAGIGGSIFVIPGLVRFAGIPQRVAAGNSLIAVSCIATTSAISFASADAVDWGMAAALAGAAALGAPLGARISTRINHTSLRRILGLLCMSLAPAMPLRTHMLQVRAEREAIEETVETKTNVPTLAGAGAAIGFASGMLGVGGGGFFTAAIATLSDVPLRVVLGTSFAAMVLPSVIAAGTYARMGLVRAALVPPLVVGGFAGAAAGSRVALAAPEHVLQWGFAVVFTVLGLRMLRAPLGKKLPKVPVKRSLGK